MCISPLPGNTITEVIFMNNSNIELPLGFGMALAQDEQAMQRFESLSADEKAAVVEQAGNVGSKREMRQFVSGIGTGGTS